MRTAAKNSDARLALAAALSILLLSCLSEDHGLPPGACEGNFDVAAPADIEDISQCISITGDLNIYCETCADLDGLEALTSVGGRLLIYGPALVNIDGLANLTEVQSSLDITGNLALESVDGLSSLTTVEQNLTIMQNSSLTDLDGLGALITVGWDLFVGGNPDLPDCQVCELLSRLNEEPTNIDVTANLDDSCTPVPEGCP